MNIKLFDYHLPAELIAQKPISPRDHSRLFVFDSSSKKIQHKHFYDLADMLGADDVLVLNETKVFPARLKAKKKTGGILEIFLLQEIATDSYQVMIGGRRFNVGDKIDFARNFSGHFIKQEKDNIWQIKFNVSGRTLDKKIEEYGQTPLPPYIKAKDTRVVRQLYQTTYAKNRGSVAAPTAGLHFTPQLLKKLEKKGVQIFKVTLHVGLGTFAPVTATDITQHHIHKEWVEIDPQTAKALNTLKKQGKNIIAVGTTSARSLEAMSDASGKLQSGAKWVDIYIYPGYKYRFVDELITNFHLPKSSLLFMVSALATRPAIMDCYKLAIKKKYRFFSFGDAMYIKHSSTRIKSE
ncbi:MAG: S-adenosylmethionine:tRNA ribosyltransferase-isomerase [Patescibacteria group bacterium]|nr:S-adenosylmethionine:tRNA ribosyltransferase-isomerase [Patescibacteria group bacterium]